MWTAPRALDIDPTFGGTSVAPRVGAWMETHHPAEGACATWRRCCRTPGCGFRLSWAGRRHEHSGLISMAPNSLRRECARRDSATSASTPHGGVALDLPDHGQGFRAVEGARWKRSLPSPAPNAPRPDMTTGPDTGSLGRYVRLQWTPRQGPPWSDRHAVDAGFGAVPPHGGRDAVAGRALRTIPAAIRIPAVKAGLR